MTLLIFLLILSVLVLIHEFGHFIVAKKLGIKVEEFGFGFPPRALSIQKGETIYSINWLPIGGFVKLYGEDEAGAGRVSLKKGEKREEKGDLKRAFFTRPVWQRALIVVAGVVMNIFLAAVIFYAFFFISNFKTSVPLLTDYKFFGVNQKNVSEIIINMVSKDSPASKAGITPFSRIVSVNGQKVTEVSLFVKIIQANKGKEISIVWLEGKTEKKKEAKIVPRVSAPKNQGALGISFFSVSTAVLTYDTSLQKTFSGITYPISFLGYNFEVIAKIIGVSLKQKDASPLGETVSGPVGIYSVVGTIVQIQDLKERILQILNLAGVLSISLAFFNILPIPALDGGRLFFILLEGVIRRRIPSRFESLVHTIGMIILLSLILLITIKDILRFLR